MQRHVIEQRMDPHQRTCVTSGCVVASLLDEQHALSLPQAESSSACVSALIQLQGLHRSAQSYCIETQYYQSRYCHSLL